MNKLRFDIMKRIFEISEFNTSKNIDTEAIGQELELDYETRTIILRYLRDEGLIKFLGENGIISRITHKGISEMEKSIKNEPSEHFQPQTVIYNLYNSSNNNIITSSKNSNINISDDIIKIKEIMGSIESKIREDKNIDDLRKKNIADIMEEIKNNLNNNKIPKFSIKNLIDIIGSISSIAGLGISLSQFL